MTGRQTEAAGAARLPNDGELFFKLVRVVNLTARPFVETLARRHHLTLNEWRAMIVLANHPGCAAHQIAEITGLDKMSVSRAVAGLVRHGRIVRSADPVDARRKPLKLSAAGARLFEAIGAGGRAREMQLFAGLDGEERAWLERLVDRMIVAVDTPQTQTAPRLRSKAAP